MLTVLTLSARVPMTEKNAEIVLYKTREQFEIILNVIVSSFRFI